MFAMYNYLNYFCDLVNYVFVCFQGVSIDLKSMLMFVLLNRNRAKNIKLYSIYTVYILLNYFITNNLFIFDILFDFISAYIVQAYGMKFFHFLTMRSIYFLISGYLGISAGILLQNYLCTYLITMVFYTCFLNIRLKIKAYK